MHQILANLGNFRFCDQICPESMDEKNFQKINVKIVISIIAMNICTKFQLI